ncbi:MAG: cysteine desulfurase [Deinococcales bacterium]|nr:cysteine desulfurase [Deinococcales bacterium]
MEHTHGGAVYLDHAATTPVDERVLEAMLPFLREEFGNPSSVHRLGQRARRALEEARERLAAAVGARPRDVVFTSGATEADNQALFGVMGSRPGGLVVGATEHPAVLTAAKRLAEAGRDVLFLAPRPDGALALEALAAALAEQATRGGTALVALMLVNNETGVLTDAAAVAELAHAHGALYLCDAVQGLGVEPVSLAATGADLLTLSAHKVNGPKGVGALVLREGLELPPLLAGGEQERGHRPGTHNLAAIAGFGVAAELAVAAQPAERERLARLQARFEAEASRLPGVSVNGAGAPRSVKHSNLRIEGADGETLLMLLDEAGVYASAGSACSAGSLDPSHVLLAMGLSRAQAKASLRFSFGRTTSEAEAIEGVRRLAGAVARSRPHAADA